MRFVVAMLRPHLRDIPAFVLPEGYQFRPFRDGDMSTWIAIQDAAGTYELGPITEALFHEFHRGRADLLPGRCWFVVDPGGNDVGSITAWWRRRIESRGHIQWVAVLPEHQGRGIGKAMMTRALHRLAEEYESASLTTDTGRIPAIKVYLDFGFVPDTANRAPGVSIALAEEGWEHARKCLKHPVLNNVDQGQR